jgi:plastocyanin
VITKLRRSLGLGLAGSLAAATLTSTAFAGAIRGTVHASGVRSPEGVVVFVDRIPGAVFPPPSTRPVIEQKALTFIPHVLAVQVGTTVDFHNGEEPLHGRAIQHNVFSPSTTRPFDLGTYGYKLSKSVTFDQPGPVTVLCNVHPEMSAYVVVVETPYFAVADREGQYLIEDVPPGRYVLKTWHPSLRPDAREVAVSDESLVDFRLRR